MSRCCEITITVGDYDDKYFGAITGAVVKLGYIEGYERIRKTIHFCSEVINIPAGLSEESVAREIVEAIWKANGAFCEVQVEIRDLDADTPCYSWDEAAFDAFNVGI